MTDQSKRTQMLGMLKQYAAGLSRQERAEFAGELGIAPVFNVVFVEAEDGRPKGEDRAS